MLKIVADDKIPFLEGVLEPFATVHYLPGKDIKNKSLKGVDALLIRTRTKCTSELLKGTSVKFIGTATIGFDHIDTGYCNSHGITWKNAPGCNSSSVQQYILASLLKMAHEFRFSLKEKTLGIVGVGNVGSKVEQAAGILGMRVLLNDPPRERYEGTGSFSSFEKLISEADIISLHVPLKVVGEDRTYHMINVKSIRKMKKGTWLINSSRGEVADTSAVKQGLKTGRLAGAVIDVWEHEPDIDRELMQESFIATPHIAGYSTDGKANGTASVVNQLSEHFGLPLKTWYPDSLPQPEDPLIEIAAKDESTEEILRITVGHTYNISEDDLRLRFSPSDFEKQRGNYPLRREFSAYTVKFTGKHLIAGEWLKKLGFVIS